MEFDTTPAGPSNELPETELEEQSLTYIPPLLSLPSELLHEIFSYLPGKDLASLLSTCHFIHEHANHELLWSSLVNSNLSEPLKTCQPFLSFRVLYGSFYPFWFLVRHRLWFSDVKRTGKLILIRYNPTKARIEGFRLVAQHLFRVYQIWTEDLAVAVNSFDPKVMLWIDDPVILLGPGSMGRVDRRKWEIQMPMNLELHRVFSAFIFCEKMKPEDATSVESVWPPRNFPAPDRVEVTHPDDDSRRALGPLPKSLDDISDCGFRVRRGIQFNNQFGILLDTLATYGTVSRELYTPTEDKPYQGIWIGDYSIHGSEFLLIVQEEGEDLAEQNGGNANANHEINVNSGQASTSTEPEPEIIPSGSLTAIKLTGDPNVPRGEISFKADDIGPNGTIRIAHEDLFEGARVVRSSGHVAETNFVGDTYIETQLFLLSHDWLAHYWKDLNTIAYYRRVDVDELISQEYMLA